MQPSFVETLRALPWTGWTSLGALAVATLLLVRHRRGHEHGFALVFLVAAACGFGVLAYRNVTLERELTTVARTLTGDATVWVHCAGTFAELVNLGRAGWAEIHDAPGGGAEAHLAPDICATLRKWEPAGTATLDEVVAVHVFVHEVVHLSGVANEAETDCIATQRTVEAVVAFGGSSEIGMQLARRYLEEVYPRMPSAYRSTECRQGGRLDRSPTDGVFP